VNAGLALAVLTVVAVIALRQIEEPFDTASDIGDAVFDLGIAYIAAWIFYYLVTWRPRAVDRWRAGPAVFRSVFALAAEAFTFLPYLQTAAGEPQGHPLSERELRGLLAKVQLTSPTGMFGAGGAHLTLAHALVRARHRVTSGTRQVDRWSGLVDVELLRLTYDLADTPMLNLDADDLVALQALPSQQLAGYDNYMHRWFTQSDRVISWLANHMADAIDTAGFNLTHVRGRQLIQLE
jgi:hypothetical protein